MTRTRVLLAAGAVVATIGAGCGGDSNAAVKLDGSPRYPDAQGVVAAVSRRSIDIGTGREYRLSDKLIAFSTYTAEAIPVLQTKGDYVQIGVRDGVVVWLARIGGVIRSNAGRPTVPYQGSLRRIRAENAEFADGTVLPLADDVRTELRGKVVAALDVERRVVVGLQFEATEATS